MERAFYRVTEVAEILGIGRSLAYRMVANGDIPSLSLAGTRTRRVSVVALQKWIDEQNNLAEGKASNGA